MGSYFDMLEFAGDASGSEAVALVAAKVVKPAAPREEGKDKKGPKDQPQYAEGKDTYVREDTYREVYGRRQGPFSGHQGGGYQGGRGRGNGRGYRYYDNSGNHGYNGNYNGDRCNYNNGGYHGNYNNGGYRGYNGNYNGDRGNYNNGGYHGNYNNGGYRGYNGNYNGDRGNYNNGGYHGNYNNGGYRGYNGNYNGDRGNYNNGGYHGNYNNGGYRGNYNGGYNNGGNRAYNYGYNNGNRGDNQVSNENNGQFQDAGYYHNNGERQGYRSNDGQPRMEYRPKSKPASEAASDADLKSEGKVEPAAEAPQKEASAENADVVPASEAASDTDLKSEGKVEPAAEAPQKEASAENADVVPASEAASDTDLKSEGKVEPAAEALQKEASAENVDAVPASESENSAGDVAKDGAEKKEGEGTEKKEGEGATKKEGEGAAKKDKKNPNVQSLDGSAKTKLKKNPEKEDSNDGEGSKKTTYNVPEVIEEEKQMTLEEYEKALGNTKSLEPSKPEEKKTSPLEYAGCSLLEKKKLEDDDRLKLESAQRKGKEVAAKEGKARKLTIQEYLKPAHGSEYVPPPPPPPSTGYRGGDGSFRGRSHDNSTEAMVHNSGRGCNPIVFHGVDANNGNGTPSRDGSQDRREGGNQQGRYNGARSNGGGYQQGGYQEGRNQEPRVYQEGGGYQERRQGGYQGGYNGGRGNGGYQQGGGRGNGGGPMVLFKDGQHVRLRCCVHGTYLHANEDGRGVSLHRYPACMNSLWVVHYQGDPHSVRLYSAAYGCYLAATNKSAPLGCDGFRVELSTYHSQEEALSWQALLTDSGPDRLFLCNIGVRCSSLSSSGRYLRANGRWNLKTVSLGEMSNITNMMEWVVEPIRDMEPHRWSYFHANGKFLPWNDKKGGVDYIKLPIRPRPRRPLHLPFLRPSRIVVFVTNHQWPRFWFTFEGRSVHRLRSEVISRLGVTSDNLVMYIRGWKYGRFTPLVVDLPRGTRTVVVTAEMRVNGWLLYTGKHRR